LARLGKKWHRYGLDWREAAVPLANRKHKGSDLATNATRLRRES